MKTTKKTAAKTTINGNTKDKAKLTAKIVRLRTEKEMSFRAIEKALAKDLGLDPSRAFGGFVAFRLFKAYEADQKAAKKAAAKATKNAGMKVADTSAATA